MSACTASARWKKRSSLKTTYARSQPNPHHSESSKYPESKVLTSVWLSTVSFIALKVRTMSFLVRAVSVAFCSVCARLADVSRRFPPCHHRLRRHRPDVALKKR